MQHFVYMSYEEWGRAYIGIHSTTNLNDGYLGSFSDKTFNPTQREILCFCKTREEAQKIEIEIQRAFWVDKNPDFANKYIHRGESFIFDRTGTRHSEESKKKISDTIRNQGIYPKHRCDWAGKKHHPETIEKMRKAALSRPRHPCPNCGKIMDPGNLAQHTKRCV